MKHNSRNVFHFIFLLLITATILIIGNAIALLYLMGQWKQVIPVSKDYILENLSQSGTSYTLSEDAREMLINDNLFAMLIDNDGDILWSEQLPESLDKNYTLQDVALFTRYYLDNYPVHTYVVDEGLLVIGGPKDSVWKYTLEYDSELVRTVVIRQLPLALLINIVILITIPLLIQRKWVSKKEVERTEWIAGVSHDIRTPLTLIIANSDYIMSNSDAASISEKAQIIQNQGLRIKSLVSNLNTSSKLSYGVGNFELQENNISSVLRNVVANIMNTDPGEQYNFDLNIDEAARLMSIKFNEELVTRMLENLINNSIRHNPDGCNISVILKKQDKQLVLEIIDDGIGATKEALKKLNSKAIAGDTKLGEHGIGLRVVRQIIDFHKWKISFDNNSPKGFYAKILVRI